MSSSTSTSDTSSTLTSTSTSTSTPVFTRVSTPASSPSSTPGPPAEDRNDCHGVSGDYWVMSRDVAVANAETFCGQGEKVVKYNEDSVNELELSVFKTDDDTRSPKDDPNCLSRLRDSVIDGCDGNDSEKNPHNFKFGSKLTSSDGWVYEMKPLSEQINEVSCEVTWQFYDDYFEIRGKNVPDEKLGANGEGLKKQLRGCGALTVWDFKPTPDDVKFQWYARGQLPVGTRSCVGNALKSAGGADRGNCHGLGRRSLTWRRRAAVDVMTTRDSIDDWPGYGEKSAHVFGSIEKRNSTEVICP